MRILVARTIPERHEFEVWCWHRMRLRRYRGRRRFHEVDSQRRASRRVASYLRSHCEIQFGRVGSQRMPEARWRCRPRPAGC